MIRSLRAFVWLRWRLVLNGVGGGHRRDTMERISRALAMGIPFVVVALSFGSVIAISVLGFVGGRLVAIDATVGPFVLAVARALLAGVFVVLVVFAFSSPVRSAMTRYSRLLLLPISHRALHLVEVLAGLADPWVAFLIPGLLCFAVGLSVSGRPGAGLVAAVAGVLLVAVLATFGATAGMLVSWLFRDRRRGEMATLVFVITLSLFSFVPIFLAEREVASDAGGARPSRSLDDVDRALPAWSRAIPSELYGRAVRGGLDGSAVTAGLAMAGLLAQAALLFAVSTAVHARLLGSTSAGRRRRRSASLSVSPRRLPGLAPATSAVALAQMRTALRSVRGRLAVLLPGPLIAIAVLVFQRAVDLEAVGVWMQQYGYAAFGGGLFFSIHSLAAFTMNLFGSDRAGLALQFLAPVSDVQLVRGKLIGCGLVGTVAAGLCLVGALAVVPSGPVSAWVGVGLGGAATCLLLSPIAVWMSALFPTAADLSRTGSAGNPHMFAAFVGFAWASAAAVPAAAILVATAVFDRPVLTVPLMLAWLALAAVVSLPLVKMASRTVGLRRENLALVALGR